MEGRQGIDGEYAIISMDQLNSKILFSPQMYSCVNYEVYIYNSQPGVQTMLYFFLNETDFLKEQESASKTLSLRAWCASQSCKEGSVLSLPFCYRDQNRRMTWAMKMVKNLERKP